MQHMLNEKFPGLIGDSSADTEQCEKIKIEYGQVALDFDAEMKQANEPNSNAERRYQLPGGAHVVVREERLRCPELLFAPN